MRWFVVTLPKESRFLPLSNLVKKCLKKKGKKFLEYFKIRWWNIFLGKNQVGLLPHIFYSLQIIPNSMSICEWQFAKRQKKKSSFFSLMSRWIFWIAFYWSWAILWRRNKKTKADCSSIILWNIAWWHFSITFLIRLDSSHDLDNGILH